MSFYVIFLSMQLTGCPPEQIIFSKKHGCKCELPQIVQSRGVFYKGFTVCSSIQPVTICTLLPPDFAFVTIIWLSVFSFSSATWEMMLTRRLPSARDVRAAMACCRLSPSMEPKPSSANIVSSFMPPAEDCFQP